MSDTIRAFAWYSAVGTRKHREPPRAAIRQMLLTIEDELERRHLRPVALSCQRWPAKAFEYEPQGDYLACIAIAVEPGELVRPLPSWFEWQHPNWEAVSPPPRLAPKVVEHEAS